MELKSECERNIQILSFLQCKSDSTCIPPFEVTIVTNNHSEDKISGYETKIDASAIKKWSTNYSKTHVSLDEFKALIRNALIQKDGFSLTVDIENGSGVLTLWEHLGDERHIIGQHDLNPVKSSLALLSIGSNYLDRTKADPSDIMLENRELKTTLTELTKEKASLEYLTYRSFTKLLNAKKRRINELETKLANLRNQNTESGRSSDQKSKSNVKTNISRAISSSSEKENSEALYSKDTDIEDSEDPDKTLEPKDWRAKTPPKDTIHKDSELKNKSHHSTRRDFDDSETDLSQSQSQENDSQYLLKPYGSSLHQEYEPNNSNDGDDSKLKNEVQDGPSVSKRRKTDEDPDMDELLENL